MMTLIALHMTNDDIDSPASRYHMTIDRPALGDHMTIDDIDGQALGDHMIIDDTDSLHWAGKPHDHWWHW